MGSDVFTVLFKIHIQLKFLNRGLAEIYNMNKGPLVIDDKCCLESSYFYFTLLRQNSNYTCLVAEGFIQHRFNHDFCMWKRGNSVFPDINELFISNTGYAQHPHSHNCCCVSIASNDF